MLQLWAGRQQPAESICSFLAVSVIISDIHLFSLPVLGIFFFFFLRSSSKKKKQEHRSLKNCTPKTGRVVFFFILDFLCYSVVFPQIWSLTDCISALDFIEKRLDFGDSNSSAHWTATVNSTERKKKITVRWPVIAERRSLPVLLLLCYRRGLSARFGHVCLHACEGGRLCVLVGWWREEERAIEGRVCFTVPSITASGMSQ